MSLLAPAPLVERLCVDCGLCCDGRLFRDVKLRSSDGPRRLRRLGMEVEMHGASSRLLQPCAAFDGSRCGVYIDRPGLCRTFECHLLRRVARGALSLAEARRTIVRARRLAKGLEAELAVRPSAGPDRSLLGRYAEAMSRPIDLGTDAAASGRRGRLARRVERYQAFVHAEFLGV